MIVFETWRLMALSERPKPKKCFNRVLPPAVSNSFALVTMEMQLPNNGPIFVLGSGRCGSTAVQRELSCLSNIWIWGEHDGILRGLTGWADSVRGSEALQRLSFRADSPSPQAVLESVGEGEANMLAWLNGFRPSDIDMATRQVITTMFTRNLPEGRTRWGFKEIRYSAEDRVAESLLELFPMSKIVHVVREPMATIKSSLVAWHSSELAALKADAALLERKFTNYANRWIESTKYYLGLRRRFPGRVFTLRIEDFSEQILELAKFLNIAETELSENRNLRRVNSLDRNGELSSNEMLRGFNEKFKDELSQWARQCGY